jgi:hypothetical protein
MKIATGTLNQVQNNIFSGFYYQRITGVKGKFYEFSSPSNPISNFSTPYDAIYFNPNFNGNRITGVGKRIKNGCSIQGDRSGALYFYNNLKIYGLCHGFGQNDLTFYSGYNFYNAFYPAGYFSPPFGENISIFKANLDGYETLKNGACNSLSVTEYNEHFGITSKSSSDADLTSSTLTANIFAPIVSPKEACPPEVTLASYFDEVQFSQIPGASQALGGIDFHNNNPIPTSLDSFDIRVNGRYSLTQDVDNNYFVVFTGGRPVPSYTISNQQNKLNNALCLASIMETSVSIGRGTNGLQLIEAPDALFGAIGDQVSFAGVDNYHYWQFIFKENADTLPFYNNFVAKDNLSSRTRRRAAGEGTPLFAPVLASDEYYWQNRQCPSVVDFLPWTFGASIYACPSEHFDVPYYAALKKFGFYGTRFLNTCKSLTLDFPLSGVENALELPTNTGNQALSDGETEPDEIDKEGSWTFSAYNNLLKVANAEDRYANMYALNRAFFLWANSGLIFSGADYNNLIATNLTIAPLFNNLLQKFANVFISGFPSFTGNEPNLVLKVTNDIFTLVSSGTTSDILLTNDEYIKFKNSIQGLLNPTEQVLWNNIESQYGSYVASGDTINEEFYRNVVSGREKRLITRYFENIVRGNPIDLYPSNNIVFSFDNAKDYIEHTGWGKRQTSFGKSSILPDINRRYFEGAYGKGGLVSGLVDTLTRFSGLQTDYYYPGFFQDIKINKENPTPTYVRAISGLILDGIGRKFSPSGWLGLGYNEIGALDSNFSCFTPIFVQSPLNRVFCKIGQKPTFRALAVDYHTIPEDKISRRYPEVLYWASRLKLLDCNFNYLYPLRYKWYRINKGLYEGALASGSIISSAEPSNQTGDWACLEGDGPECSLIHPKDSYPVFTGVHSNPQNYTFIKGAVKNQDDNYYYICVASGRFGVRISNPTELNVEDWLRFDISVKNGLNLVSNVKVDFDVSTYNGQTRTVSFTSTQVPKYGGYQQDSFTAAESVVEQKIPPPNAGWGDVTAYRFIGPVGYIGATRTYTPSALKDTRGVREVWGHMLDYGQLVPFEKIISQFEGDALYGYSHLPVCANYGMADGQKGVKSTVYMNGYKVGHWSLPQQAVASLDNQAGVQYTKLGNIGELYPPVNARYDSPNFGIGHWQWGNNLGAIKRFGKFSDFASQDITFVGGGEVATQEAGNAIIEKVKDKLLGSTDLAGENCGYHRFGLGRNMLYYLEAFERFYILCDPVKKKNVSNKTFMCPGLRMTNSAIQYFWLGRPNNTYLKRRPMYGPYAYQWKVFRHNRDRNGNGISEGFYSMGYGSKYSLQYDAPASFGLYVKKRTSSAYLTNLKDLKTKRDLLVSKYNFDVSNLRNTWFGERRNEGTSRAYGNVTFSCNPSGSDYKPDICDYVGTALSLATNINFGDHSCPQDLLAKGECFDPCLSMNYSQGFFPGGKSLDLLSHVSQSNINSEGEKNIRLVPLAKISNGAPVFGDEKIDGNDSLQFRNPLNTPHARITQGLKTIALETITGKFIGGISPCQDGGSEHCNFITPTIHLGISSYLVGEGTAFSQMKNYIANVYENLANIRGEIY